MNCKNCGHYELYKMITSGMPYGYSGDIPCTRCKHFQIMQDEFIPMFSDRKGDRNELTL